MAPQLISIRCNFCSKFRPPFRVHQFSQAQTICDYCMEWHYKALDVLAGITGHGCQECNRTWDEIRAADPQGQRLWVVPKDGIYQLLCKRCVQPYLPKRADLYSGTRFGREGLNLG
jgi:hypothetical protein